MHSQSFPQRQKDSPEQVVAPTLGQPPKLVMKSSSNIGFRTRFSATNASPQS